jgi:hypothetical protein
MSCETAPVHRHSDRACAAKSSTATRGRIDLPERFRYPLTDSSGTRHRPRAEFPIAMACRVSIHVSCKRICLKWVNRVVSTMVRPLPVCTL